MQVSKKVSKIIYAQRLKTATRCWYLEQ